MMILKRVITNQYTLSKATSALAFAVTAKFHLTFSNFCTEISPSSTTSVRSAVVSDFLINNCGLTPEEIEKAFRHNRKYLHAKSTRNMKEVLELLKGCGLTNPPQIRRVVLNSPTFLFRSAERNIQAKLTLLGTYMNQEDICKLLLARAKIFESAEDKLNSSFLLLQRLGVKGQELSELVARVPALLTASEEKVLELFQHAEDFGRPKGSKMFARVLRIIFWAGKENMDRRLRCLNSLGFSKKQISEILRRRPEILLLSEENLKHHVDFLVKFAGLTLADFDKDPLLFQLSLEKRVIPRCRVIKALKSMGFLKTKMHFRHILRMSEKSFLEIYVDSNEKSSVLLDIYRCVKDGKLNIDMDTSSELDVGPTLGTVNDQVKP